MQEPLNHAFKFVIQGFDHRRPASRKGVYRHRLTQVFGSDFQAFEELNWTINTNVITAKIRQKACSG
jgi:hypothetical protein